MSSSAPPVEAGARAGALPDGVIFDVDGVLVDVTGSFLAAVARSVQWLVVRETGLRDDAALVDPGVIAAFKRAAGFNNDWDLAHALTLWYLRSVRASQRTTSDLRRDAGDPAKAARVSLPERVRALPRPAYDDVKGLMLELFWGSEEAARRFGVPKRLANDDPLMSRERVLLREDTVVALERLGVRRFGIVTGRLRVEWEAVRERLPLPRDAAVVTDEDGRKPDPSLLARVVGELDLKHPCYVGDVMDDWRFVASYNASGGGRARPALGVIVCDEAEEAAFRRAGARHFARDVNELPRLLASP